MGEKKIVAEGVSLEQVKLLIAGATEGLVTVGQLAGELEKLGFVVITEDSIKHLVAEGVKAIPQINAVELCAEVMKQIQPKLQAFITTEDLNFALHDLQPHSLVEIAGGQKEEPFDTAWLEGLTFKGAEQTKEKVKGQRPKMVSKPFERPLSFSDVLDYSVGDDTVTLITKDGQKHTVEI